MEHHIVPMSKRKFRIGDLADELKVKKYVIRFWEKEFELKSDRSDGGQRFYTEDDLNLFIKIKELLYRDGFTILGARKQLGMLDGIPEETYQGSSVTFHEEQPEDVSNFIAPSDQVITAACLDTELKKQQKFLVQLSEFKEKLLEIKKRINQK